MLMLFAGIAIGFLLSTAVFASMARVETHQLHELGSANPAQRPRLTGPLRSGRAGACRRCADL